MAASTSPDRVRDIYVGADAFLLIANPVWMRGHYQMGTCWSAPLEAA
jgi:hypothetical protein